MNDNLKRAIALHRNGQIDKAEILYLDLLKKDENKGKYQLGGCCISNDDPAFSCNDCGFLFGHREEN